MIMLVGEGLLDLAVLRRLMQGSGKSIKEINARGKGNLDKNLSKYNASARHVAWCVLRDFDRDATCPGLLVRSLLPQPAEKMCFRLAVRAVEAWLLADVDGFADTFKIRRPLLPANPEQLSSPKATVLDLLVKSARKEIAGSMVVRGSSGRLMEGPEYNAGLEAYVTKEWELKRAIRSAPSLRRAVDRIAETLANNGMP